MLVVPPYLILIIKCDAEKMVVARRGCLVAAAYGGS